MLTPNSVYIAILITIANILSLETAKLVIVLADGPCWPEKDHKDDDTIITFYKAPIDGYLRTLLYLDRESTVSLD